MTNGTILTRQLQFDVTGSALALLGGTITVSSSLLVGANLNSNLVATVQGGSLYVTNSAHSAITEVRYGSLIITAGVFCTDSLLVTNPSGSFVNNGGTFCVTGQAQVDTGTNTFSSGTTMCS